MQARALARALDDEAFDYAVSSDLSRALETAQTIRGRARVVRDERWREFDFGEWEGLTWEEIVERFPEMLEHGTTAAKRYAPPGGETFEAVCGRVGRALEELRATPYGNVLVVTHAGPLHAMLHTLFGDRGAQMQEVLGVRFSPASVTRITIDDGRPELIALNDVAHLDTSR
jgi:broad specificity phosphatase PhoE